MMKRVVIVHQWSGGPDKDFIPWLKKELEERGLEVLAPEMPDPDHPRIIPWVNRLLEFKDLFDEETVLVGHSIGCQTILRALERMDKRVGKVILIAPWFSLTNLENEESVEIAEPWIKTPIDWEEVKTKANLFIALFSRDDYFVPFEDNLKVFKEKLGAEIVILDKRGHFTEDDGIKEVPEILNYI